MFPGNLNGSRRCSVTSLGNPSFTRRRRLPSSVLRWKALLLLVLRCYGFTKSWIHLASLSQPDVKGECLAKLPGHPRPSKFESEDERGIFELVISFKQTDFSTLPAAVPIRLFFWGGVPPPHCFFWPSPHHMIFNLSHEIYTYRPFIRAVIIHYDAKV